MTAAAHVVRKEASISRPMSLSAFSRQRRIVSMLFDRFFRTSFNGPSPQSGDASSRDLYIDLLKRSIINLPYLEYEGNVNGIGSIEELTEKRMNGADWPPFAPSMIGWKRLTSLQELVEKALRENVPGDLFEAGVWRGGASILMRGILAAYGEKKRKVWLADSFEGLPKPNAELYPDDVGDNHFEYEQLAVTVEDVKTNFRRFGLLDGNLVFLKGWFSDTLPACSVNSISVLRLDGDMYESTIVSLRSLYDKVSSGGFVIVDDYGYLESCRKAVSDFQSERGFNIKPKMVDWTGAWWRKP